MPSPAGDNNLIGKDVGYLTEDSYFELTSKRVSLARLQLEATNKAQGMEGHHCELTGHEWHIHCCPTLCDERM